MVIARHRRKPFAGEQLSAAQPPPPTASPEERVRNIATTTVELLNALKLGHFILGTTTIDRVVIEKIPA